jgi:uncharacterized protein with HEPN domain
MCRDDRERLLDVLDAIERIDRYASRGWEEFASNELIQLWVVRHLEIVGEAVRGLSTEFRREHLGRPLSYRHGRPTTLAPQVALTVTEPIE